MKLAQRTWFVGLSALVLAAVSGLATTTNALGSNNEGTIEAAATDAKQPSKRPDADKAKCGSGKEKSAGCKIDDKAKCCADEEKAACKAGDKAECGEGKRCVDRKKLDVAEVSDATENSTTTTKLHDLNDIQQLRKAFNAANGRPRLILLLSPT